MLTSLEGILKITINYINVQSKINYLHDFLLRQNYNLIDNHKDLVFSAN